MAQKDDKSIQYSYVKPVNKNHVKKVSLKANRPESEFIDELISAHRLKRDVKFDARIPKSVQKVQRAQARKKQKLKSLGA